MPRPRKPLTRVDAHNRGRLLAQGRLSNKGEVLELTTDLPFPAEAPDFFPEDARDEWRRILSDSKYAECLAGIDTALAESYVLLFAKQRELARDGEILTAPNQASLIQLAAKLGMSPTDRSKIVRAPAKKEANRFARLAAVKL